MSRQHAARLAPGTGLPGNETRVFKEKTSSLGKAPCRWTNRAKGTRPESYRDGGPRGRPGDSVLPRAVGLLDMFCDFPGGHRALS